MGLLERLQRLDERSPGGRAGYGTRVDRFLVRLPRPVRVLGALLLFATASAALARQPAAAAVVFVIALGRVVPLGVRPPVGTLETVRRVPLHPGTPGAAVQVLTLALEAAGYRVRADQRGRRLVALRPTTTMSAMRVRAEVVPVATRDGGGEQLEVEAVPAADAVRRHEHGGRAPRPRAGRRPPARTHAERSPEGLRAHEQPLRTTGRRGPARPTRRRRRPSRRAAPSGPGAPRAPRPRAGRRARRRSARPRDRRRARGRPRPAG